jgi:hypothetical protein
MKHYFLLGSTACKILREEGLDECREYLRKVKHRLIEVYDTENGSIGDFAKEIVNYHEVIQIPEQDYNFLMKKKKSPKELYQEQLYLMEVIRIETGINIVTCGHCGTVILRRLDDEDIECYSDECKDNEAMGLCDCPDLFY